MIPSVIKKPSLSLLILFLILIQVASLYGQQRISYESLDARSQDQGVYLDSFTLPSDDQLKVQLITTFRINNSAIPFKKTGNSSIRYEYFSPVTLSIEVFKSDKTRKENRDKNEFSVEGLDPVSRNTWKDTAYAESYEQTKEHRSHIEGFLETDLDPGSYSYIFQLIRGEDLSEESSRRRTVKLLPYYQKNQGNVILAKNVTNNGTTKQIQLLNFGNNVIYGEDFHVLVHLPRHEETDRYNLSVNEINISRSDTSASGSVYSDSGKSGTIVTGVRPRLSSDSDGLSITLAETDGRGVYLIHKIPNRNFENSVYRLTVKRMGQNAPVAQSIFRSKWVDMPTSLLNLDVAINMLRFIEDDETINRLKSGSEIEKEKKFKSYWNQRDPTPETEFNELMEEYYRRIDYAYDEFSSINTSGYNTDRGKIYIKYGPPENIERTFPSNEPAVEIWTYPSNRKFVFRATSGFGDFKLVNSSNN